MDRLEALKELEASVVAGSRPWREASDADGKFSEFEAVHALNAFDGSLDAAKELHEAALPGWGWLVSSEDTAMVDKPVPNGCPRYLRSAGFCRNDARTWLLAIIRALIAQQEADNE